MAAVQRTVKWAGQEPSRGAPGAPAAAAARWATCRSPSRSRFGEPEGKTSPEELIAAAHAAAFDQAAQQAERSCPASRALQGNVAIAVHATLEGPPASLGIGAA